MARSYYDKWEFRATNGTANAGGGFLWLPLVSSAYKWTASGSGTNEYYCELAAGGDPSLSGQTGMSVTTDGTTEDDTEGTAGSLNAGEWDWGDNDTLGYSTVYVRLDDGTDPDSNRLNTVMMGATGGKDYTKQAAAQLQLTDLATSGIGVTTLTSATGGFTALMIDSYIQIRSGTNVTAGFYRITGHTDTNTVALDSAPDDGVGGISGGSGDLGGALDVMDDAFLELLIPGNQSFVNPETWTLVGNISLTADGSGSGYITISGYNTTRGDGPTGDNRPLFAAGPNQLVFDDFWEIENVRVTTTHADGLRADIAGMMRNCKSFNSSGTAGRSGLELQGAAVECEGISTNGIGIQLNGNGSSVVSCYAHDSVTGFAVGNDQQMLLDSVADTCSTSGAVAGSGDALQKYVGNVFYNCGVGLDFGTLTTVIVVSGNIFKDNATGLATADLNLSKHIDNNVWHGNTTDITGGHSRGPNSVVGDPNFTDAANGDFTLASSSSAVDAAAKHSTATGVVGTYKSNCGVDQTDPDAGGGGAASVLGGGALTGGFS